MRKASLPLASVFLLIVLAVFSCVPPRAPPRDAGVEAEDAGAPMIFSVGITDNNGAVHQVAPVIQLLFETGTLGPSTVVSRRVDTPPKLDGLDNDWSKIGGSVIPLSGCAAAIGMTEEEWYSGFGLLDGGVRPYDLGIDSVKVKSAYDDTSIYFLLQWADATKNDSKNRLTLVDGGWVRSTEDEDRLFLSFDVNFPAHRELGCIAACHLRERLDDTTDAGRLWRNRMHTSAPGEIADVWSWGSVATNAMGHADDIAWDDKNKVSDDTVGFSSSNRKTVDGGTVPVFMSEDGINANPTVLYAADSGLHPAAVPYDGTGALPGATLPGSVYQLAGGSRADVRAVGLWRNGKWTVEIARARVTADPNDTQFNIP